MPILMQLAASGLSEAARSSQLGSLRRLRMRGLERAMMYSVLHRSFSRISHSSLHKSRGLSMPELRSHVGKAKWHREGIANWEQRSDRWLEVPIIVNAAGKNKTKTEISLLYSGFFLQIWKQEWAIVDSNKLHTGLVYSREIISYTQTAKRQKFQWIVAVSQEVVWFKNKLTAHSNHSGMHVFLNGHNWKLSHRKQKTIRI